MKILHFRKKWTLFLSFAWSNYYCNPSAVDKVFNHAKSKKVSTHKCDIERLVFHCRMKCGHRNRKYLHLPHDRYHCNSNGISGIFDHAKCEETDPGRLRPEMAMWSPKPETLIHLKLWQMYDSSNGKFWVFNHAQLAETNPGRLQQQPTTGNCNMDVLLANLAVSGSRLLSQSSLWLILCRPRHHRKSLIWRGNLDTTCHSSRDVIISIFGAISIFTVVDRCYTHLPIL